MKKTYLFVITTVLTIAFSAKAQLNELNVNELAQIKFNNTSLTQIRQIAGNDQKAEALFGKGNFEAFQNETCPFPCRDYKINNNAIYVGFEESNEGYFFAALYVNSPSVQVTVKNVTVSIGDSIDVFKKKGYLINEKHNWVVFIDKDTATIDIAFSFHPRSRKITKIQMTTY